MDYIEQCNASLNVFGCIRDQPAKHTIDESATIAVMTAQSFLKRLVVNWYE